MPLAGLWTQMVYVWHMPSICQVWHFWGIVWGFQMGAWLTIEGKSETTISSGVRYKLEWHKCKARVSLHNYYEIDCIITPEYWGNSFPKRANYLFLQGISFTTGSGFPHVFSFNMWRERGKSEWWWEGKCVLALRWQGKSLSLQSRSTKPKWWSVSLLHRVFWSNISMQSVGSTGQWISLNFTYQLIRLFCLLSWKESRFLAELLVRTSTVNMLLHIVLGHPHNKEKVTVKLCQLSCSAALRQQQWATCIPAAQ